MATLKAAQLFFSSFANSRQARLSIKFNRLTDRFESSKPMTDVSGYLFQFTVQSVFSRNANSQTPKIEV